ncbi:MAG: hypothetical protein V8S31_03920 [Lachnospiraceae bacterium]
MEIDTIATEIKATDIEGLRIGQAKSEKGKTGVTVLLFDQPATGGVDISGGGPASRETPLSFTAYGKQSDPCRRSFRRFGVWSESAEPVSCVIWKSMALVMTPGLRKCRLCASPAFMISDREIRPIRPDAQMGYDACVDAEVERAEEWE